VSLQVSDSVIWQETGEGVSLYHTETGDFLTLNATGAQIWILVAADGEREPVISKMSLLFGGGTGPMGGRIRAEVDEFISQMIASGLLTETGPA
jgi:hypothetical protein